MCKFIKYYAFSDRYECYYLNPLVDPTYSDKITICDLDCSDLLIFLKITKSIFIPFLANFGKTFYFF
jgi:hypothetical protein